MTTELSAAESDSGDVAGKPRYTLEDLRRLDQDILRARLSCIDNQTARDIATQLWNRVMACRREMFRQPGKDGRPLSMKNLAGKNFPELPILLENMRLLNFSQIVISKSSMIIDRLQELPALTRLLLPNPYPRHSQHVADHLIRYLDLYINPHKRLPQHLSYLGFECIAWAGMICIVLRSLLDWPIWTLLIFLSPILLLSSRITLTRNLQRVRLLALYISFTDEFVSEKRCNG